MPKLTGYTFRYSLTGNTVAMYGANANLKKVFEDLTINGWEMSDKGIEIIDGEMIIWVR